MPAPRADIDREGICASIALHGYRETARRTGVPIGTVHRIGKVAGVVAPDPLMRPAQRITEVRTLASIGTAERIGTAALPAHAVVSDELQFRGQNSRLNAAIIGDKALADIAEKDGEVLLASLEAANQAGSLLQKGNVPGWERQQEQQAQQVVNIALLGVELPKASVELALDQADASGTVLSDPQS